MEGVDTVDAAMVIGQKFVDWGAMIPLDGDGDFHPLPTSLYKFVETERSGSGSAIRPKTTSVHVRSPDRRELMSAPSRRRGSLTSIALHHEPEKRHTEAVKALQWLAATGNVGMT